MIRGWNCAAMGNLGSAFGGQAALAAPGISDAAIASASVRATGSSATGEFAPGAASWQSSANFRPPLAVSSLALEAEDNEEAQPPAAERPAVPGASRPPLPAARRKLREPRLGGTHRPAVPEAPRHGSRRMACCMPRGGRECGRRVMELMPLVPVWQEPKAGMKHPVHEVNRSSSCSNLWHRRDRYLKDLPATRPNRSGAPASPDGIAFRPAAFGISLPMRRIPVGPNARRSNGSFLRLVAVMERHCRTGRRRSNRIGGDLGARKSALAGHGTPKIFGTGQGLQCARTGFAALLHGAKSTIFVDGRGHRVGNRGSERQWPIPGVCGRNPGRAAARWTTSAPA